MLSFLKRRSLDLKREAGTYHELQNDGCDYKLPISEEMQASPTQPIYINNPNFDILQLPDSLTGKIKANANSPLKIPSLATGPVRRPTRRLRFARAPNPKKCQSVIRELQLILGPCHSQQELAKAPAAPSAKESLRTFGAKDNGKRILMHLNNPRYANTIISMLKEEPHRSYLVQPAGTLEHTVPRGVCLGARQTEFGADAAPGRDMEDVMDVGKASTMRESASQEVINLVTGLSAGTLMSALGASTGLYDALAMGSKSLIGRTEAHQDLIGMVPKDRASVWCYWWGFEIALPPQSLESLKTARSIESAAVPMLAALSAAGGAVELLPFIRLIGAYLDVEWGALNEQNRGKGVVIAATWALPMALVPRPWDFDSPVVLGPPTEEGHLQGLAVLAASR